MKRGHGAGSAPPAAAMAQEAFSDYHLYTLGRRTTINNSETKQVSMLSGTGVPTLKRYVVNGQAFYYRNAQLSGRADQGRRAGVLPVQERAEGWPRDADAGRGRSACIRRIRKTACTLSARTASTTRRRTKRSTSRSATPSTSSASGSRPTSARSPTNVYEFEYEITLRNHKATRGIGGSQRADRRHLGR